MKALVRTPTARLSWAEESSIAAMVGVPCALDLALKTYRWARDGGGTPLEVGPTPNGLEVRAAVAPRRKHPRGGAPSECCATAGRHGRAILHSTSAGRGKTSVRFRQLHGSVEDPPPFQGAARSQAEGASPSCWRPGEGPLGWLEPCGGHSRGRISQVPIRRSPTPASLSRRTGTGGAPPQPKVSTSNATII